MISEVVYKDLALVEYGECWGTQQGFFDALLEQKAGKREGAEQVLILCEHPHVYTLGKSGERANMLISDERMEQIGATYFKIDRGGDITYHGPGQLVGYPILDLEQVGVGLRAYIEAVEESIIRTLAHYGIVAGRSEGAAGVWLKAEGEKPLRKICAIGVRSSRFVTMHGFAMNVNTDLNYFSYINPCGFVDRGVTSIEKELGRKVDMGEVKELYVKYFEQAFENIKIK